MNTKFDLNATVWTYEIVRRGSVWHVECTAYVLRRIVIHLDAKDRPVELYYGGLASEGGKDDSLSLFDIYATEARALAAGKQEMGSQDAMTIRDLKSQVRRLQGKLGEKEQCGGPMDCPEGDDWDGDNIGLVDHGEY